MLHRFLFACYALIAFSAAPVTAAIIPVFSCSYDGAPVACNNQNGNFGLFDQSGPPLTVNLMVNSSTRLAEGDHDSGIVGSADYFVYTPGPVRPGFLYLDAGLGGAAYPEGGAAGTDASLIIETVGVWSESCGPEEGCLRRVMDVFPILLGTYLRVSMSASATSSLYWRDSEPVGAASAGGVYLHLSLSDENGEVVDAQAVQAIPTSVPEPATALLLAAGIVSLAATLYRRARPGQSNGRAL